MNAMLRISAIHVTTVTLPADGGAPGWAESAAARGGSDPPDVSKFSPPRHLVRCLGCPSVASR